MVKHVRFFSQLTFVLGFVFLAVFFAVDWSVVGPLNNLMIYLWLFLLMGGTFFLTAGVCGIGRQYFKSEKGAFTALAVLAIPFFVFALWFLVWSSKLTVGL